MYNFNDLYIPLKNYVIRPATLFKTDYNTGVFASTLGIFKNTFFYRTPPVAASENNEQQ